jgi:hypothetical protein
MDGCAGAERSRTTLRARARERAAESARGESEGIQAGTIAQTNKQPRATTHAEQTSAQAHARAHARTNTRECRLAQTHTRARAHTRPPAWKGGGGAYSFATFCSSSHAAGTCSPSARDVPRSISLAQRLAATHRPRPADPARKSQTKPIASSGLPTPRARAVLLACGRVSRVSCCRTRGRAPRTIEPTSSRSRWFSSSVAESAFCPRRHGTARA